MPRLRPFKSDTEAAAAYIAKYPASKKSFSAEKKEYTGGKGVYVRTAQHRKKQHKIQKALVGRKKQKPRKSRKDSKLYQIDKNIVLSVVENITGISPFLTCPSSKGDSQFVRMARNLEWFCLKKYSRMKAQDIADMYCVKKLAVEQKLCQYNRINKARRNVRSPVQNNIWEACQNLSFLRRPQGLY